MRHRLLRTSPTAAAANDGSVTRLHEGDLVRWHDRLLELTDVADFVGAGVYVTAVFVDGSRRSVSLRATDLDGAEVWCRVGRLTAPT
jgi:hypothetical protein